MRVQISTGDSDGGPLKFYPNMLWINIIYGNFFGRNDAKAETPVLWPPHVKSSLIGKDSDAGRDWGQEEKGTTEDEMAGWHHWLDGRESQWTLGVGDGQGGLACCNSWGRKESDTTERLNGTELMLKELRSFYPSLYEYEVFSYFKDLLVNKIKPLKGILLVLLYGD